MSFFSRLFRSKPKLMTWQEFVEYFARRIQEELDLEAKIDWGENNCFFADYRPVFRRR